MELAIDRVFAHTWTCPMTPPAMTSWSFRPGSVGSWVVEMSSA